MIYPKMVHSFNFPFCKRCTLWNWWSTR